MSKRIHFCHFRVMGCKRPIVTGVVCPTCLHYLDLGPREWRAYVSRGFEEPKHVAVGERIVSICHNKKCQKEFEKLKSLDQKYCCKACFDNDLIVSRSIDGNSKNWKESSIKPKMKRSRYDQDPTTAGRSDGYGRME